jgi:hypothetical protein
MAEALFGPVGGVEPIRADRIDVGRTRGAADILPGAKARV